MNLTTQYLGLTLKNPVVASSSRLTGTIDSLKQIAEAGAAAVVLPSLFEEQINQEGRVLDHYLTHSSHSHAEALSYFPDLATYNIGPDSYLELVARAKQATGIPVIGSLNGVSAGGWTRYARLIQEAGADALELNIYYIPTDGDLTGAEVEQMYLDVLRDVRQSVSIPVAVKLSPHFSSVPNMARRLTEAGANGLVLFNRFYQPDFDLDQLEVAPRLHLSTSDDLRLPLRWTAILYGRVQADLALTGGVHTSEDVLKAMMAGARVAMMTSALLQEGPGHIAAVLDGMAQWMEEHEYESVAQMQGSMSQKHVAEPAAFERANYMKILQSGWSLRQM
jgi:dihydroorotate dehydrogenase (fumarate)